MPRPTPSTALAPIRVLDLTRVRAGPTCTRILADFGADVIKIESPPGLDPNENMSGPRHGYDMQNLHRNKRSLTLNLKTNEGMTILRRLVPTADVVAENFRPDVKDRLGLDYGSLRALNPRIILASVSGFGQTGPYRTRPGFDQIAQGMGGLMAVTGLPSQGPVRAGIAVADSAAGVYAAVGVLVALAERERSGEGQWVQTSLLQAMIAMMDFQAARYLVEGSVPPQAGNDHPYQTSPPIRNSCALEACCDWRPPPFGGALGMGGVETVAAAVRADLAARLPSQNKKQREGLALLVATALDVRSVNLMELAAAVPRAAERLDMRYQWISRLLGNARIDVEAVMAPYAREVLARAGAGSRALVVIIDQSKVNDAHHMVMVSLRVGERALPLAWCMKKTQGAIGFREQRDALTTVAALLPEGVRPTLMGDRFYGSPALIAWCRDHGWGWRLRCKQDLL